MSQQTDTKPGQPGFAQPIAFVPLMRQPHLPHQFDLRYCLVKTRVRPVCNCKNWEGMAYRPDDPEGLPFARFEYAAHLLMENVEGVDEATYSTGAS